MDINLPEDHRSKLDDIVQRAVANGESEDNIRFIVQDYKQKYNQQGRSLHNDSAQGPNRYDPVSPASRGETPGSDVFRNFVGRFIPSGLGVAGSYGGPVMGAAGSLVGEGLRQTVPSLFGGEDSGNVGSDLVVNSLIPGALKSVGKVATDGFRQTLADILATKGGQKLPPVRNLMQANSEVSPIFEHEARDARLRGFTAPEPNLDQVKAVIQRAQDNSKEIKNPILRYARNSLIFRLGVLGGLGGVSQTAAGVGTTLVLGEAAIKKLVSNPETAQLIIKAINTPGDAQESGLIGKTLINALRGSTVMLKDADGNDTSATVSQDGQLQYKK